MRTSTVVAVIALSAPALVSAARPKPGKMNFNKAVHHVSKAAGAAEHVGNAVSAFRGNQRRADNDDLYARDYDDELYAREFDDELYAREYDDVLYAREYDDALWARDDFEELFARAVGEKNTETSGQNAQPSTEHTSEKAHGSKAEVNGAHPQHHLTQESDQHTGHSAQHNTEHTGQRHTGQRHTGQHRKHTKGKSARKHTKGKSAGKHTKGKSARKPTKGKSAVGHPGQNSEHSTKHSVVAGQHGQQAAEHSEHAAQHSTGHSTKQSAEHPVQNSAEHHTTSAKQSGQASSAAYRRELLENFLLSRGIDIDELD